MVEMIKVGESAPDFTLTAHDGGSLSIASLRGAKVLLWFFVEANTPGCTLEGRGFHDHQSYFDENNIRVVGVSFDSPEDNAAFARRHELGSIERVYDQVDPRDHPARVLADVLGV